MSVQMSSDPQIQAQHKINEIITQLHRILSHNFTSMEQSRDLQPDENMILSQLHQKSVHYQNLVGILAIDTYVHNILNHMQKFNDVLASLTIHIQNFLECKRQNFPPKAIESVHSSLLGIMYACHKYSPDSCYVQLHKKLIDEEPDQYQDSQQIIRTSPPQTVVNQLIEENATLKKQLKQTDYQIIDLELKLTNLLKQHDQYQNQQNQNNNTLLQDELFRKQEQIQGMNQQFAYEIQKYNTVFDCLRQEISQLRANQYVQTYRDVERLEKQVSHLLAEKQRDTSIIEELRDRITFMEDISGYDPRRSSKVRGNRNYMSKQYQRY